MKSIRILAAAALLAGLACVAAATPAGAGPQGWKVVKSKSASGDFAITAVSATINHPRVIAVRFSGRAAQGMAVYACARGFSIGSWSRSYSHAGTYVLKIPANRESCDVTVSGSGEGRITVAILKS